MTTLAGRRAPLASSPVARPTRRRARNSFDVWRAAAITVITATSVAVVALWLGGGGIQATLGADTETLNTLGRLTGLVSANLLLYQVLLMARVPVFERGFGREGITRMHRIVGFWSFWLLLAHIGLLVAGYAAQAAVNPFAQLWDFVWNYPGMLLATAGTLLLIAVVVSSIRRSRRRLRYESWHLLHLYGYLGVGLAIPHMLWTGDDFAGNAAATAYWWSLWALVAACVVVFRIARPLWQSARHGIRVQEVRAEGTHGVSVTMRGRGLHRLRAEAGQFFVWRFLDGPGWTRGHPLSLAAAPESGELVISARVVGDGTRRLTTVTPGTRVLIEGPYGHMTGRLRRGRKLLMLASGAGVSPLISLLESEPYARDEAVLVTRDHAPEQRLRAAQIDALVRTRGVRHVALDGARSTGASAWLPATYDAWRGADVLRHLAPDIDAYDAYLCGPLPWMASVRADLRAAGAAADRIHSEAFAV